MRRGTYRMSRRERKVREFAKVMAEVNPSVAQDFIETTLGSKPADSRPSKPPVEREPSEQAVPVSLEEYREYLGEGGKWLDLMVEMAGRSRSRVEIMREPDDSYIVRIVAQKH